MTKTTPTYELKSDSDLSKFLLGAIRYVRKAELDVERAEAISQLSDKYIKLKIARCLEAKITKRTDLLDVGSEMSKQLLQKVNYDEE